ncbi:NUDIX hydrolase [Halobacillus mangrovi]|uniref:NUDIX hydrolase n=1 Tax=Halobacillus mangrovi TaxID=402384 RepID=UPI003D989DC4
MNEKLTIFNEQEQPIGVKSREDIHRDGDWHETFQCWFYEVNQEDIFLYFQKRAEDKKDFPGLYDITAAGHIEAGERVVMGGVREIEEEIGVNVSPSDLIEAGTFKQDLSDGNLKDKEICRVFLFNWDGERTFSIGEEVADVVKVALHSFKEVVNGEVASVSFHSVLAEQEGFLSMDQLVPHDRAYYQFIIKAITENVEKL